MSKAERLSKHIDLLTKFILFYMGLIVLIIGYSYQHAEATPLLALIPVTYLLYKAHNNVNKDLKDLENE